MPLSALYSGGGTAVKTPICHGDREALAGSVGWWWSTPWVSKTKQDELILKELSSDFAAVGNSKNKKVFYIWRHKMWEWIETAIGGFHASLVLKSRGETGVAFKWPKQFWHTWQLLQFCYLTSGIKYLFPNSPPFFRLLLYQNFVLWEGTSATLQTLQSTQWNKLRHFVIYGYEIWRVS